MTVVQKAKAYDRIINISLNMAIIIPFKKCADVDKYARLIAEKAAKED